MIPVVSTLHANVNLAEVSENTIDGRLTKILNWLDGSVLVHSRSAAGDLG